MEQEGLRKMADHLFRENSGKMAAVLCKAFGLSNIDRVLDIVQDTFEAALVQWKFSGIPQNPSAWLMQVAKNKAINTFRREAKTTRVSSSVFARTFDKGSETELDAFFLPSEVQDSQLRLLLTCCHPDFSEKNQVIITLHILCGFGVPEIANALLMEKEAVKKALARTKAALREKKDILHTPALLRYEKRIHVTHTIIYLIYNEGYKTTRSSEMINNDLCYEAIRLAKLLLGQGAPLQSEVNALLALMFFNLVRFPSRLSSDGEIITLQDQDRTKWNRAFLTEGHLYLREAAAGDTLSRYHLEAMIASIHCSAPTFAETDWEKIVYLCEQLERIAPSPLVTLNKIVARSYLTEPGAILVSLEKLKQEPALKNHYLLYAAEGDVLSRSGQLQKAKAAYLKAAGLAVSPLDRQFLERKVAQCLS